MTPEDESAGVQPIVLAFAADPVARWMWPNAQQYLAAMPRLVPAFGGQAFRRCSAYANANYAGATLWLPPGVEPDDERLNDVMQSTVSESELADGAAMFEQM